MGVSMDLFYKLNNFFFLPQSDTLLRQRLVFVMGGIFLFYSVLLIQLFLTVEDWMPLRSSVPLEKGNFLVTGRGDIVDRHGIVLATNLPSYNLYVRPHEILDIQEVLFKLDKVFLMNHEELLPKLQSTKNFVYLKRNITPGEYDTVNRLGIPGVYVEQSEKRVYPHGKLFSHILGATGYDNQGIAGIEYSKNEFLQSNQQVLQLSVDIRVQNVLYQELHKAMKKYKSFAAMGAIMDVATGEIIASVSLPDYDPYEYGKADREAHLNRISHAVYEMGSTFKIFNTVLALEENVIQEGEVFDVSEPVEVAGYVFKGNSKDRLLNVVDILVKSSNLGSLKIALRFGQKKQKNFFQKIGFLDRLKCELVGTPVPIYPKPWLPVNVVTIAYGHGMAVTPLHMLRGMSMISNGGILYPVSFLKQSALEKASGERIISENTSKAVRVMLYEVMERGTGKKASIDGYYIGGKTGTADKLNASKRYGGENVLTNILGVFPVHHPKYSFIFMIDEPKSVSSNGNLRSASWNAVPMAHDILQKIAPLLGVFPYHNFVVSQAKED